MKHAILLLPLLAILVGCGGGDSVPAEDVVARVNDEVLTRTELTAMLPNGEWDTVSLADKQAIVDDWKRLTLLSQLAVQEGYDADPAVCGDISAGKRKILANALLRDRLRQAAPPEDVFEQQMHEYYQTQFEKKRYTFTLQMLTVYDAELAETVWNELQAGMSFYDVYQKHGQGDIAYTRGTVTQGMISDELYDELANAQQYRVVRASGDGAWEAARWLHRQEVELGFEHPEAQKKIRRLLTEQREQELVERLIREQEAASEIVIEL